MLEDACDFSLPADLAAHATLYLLYARTIDYFRPVQADKAFYEGLLKWLKAVSG